MSATQYNNTVRDLLRVEGDFSRAFHAGGEGAPDELGVERRARAAAEVTRLALSTRAQWLPCDPEKVGSDACGRQVVERLALRAFRRPLVEPERAQLNALFTAGLREGDFLTGIEWLLTGVLQAPDFLYQVALPTAFEKPGDVLALDDFALASRLAYFLWDGPPDDALLAAAAAKELGDPDRSRPHIDRMLRDPRSQRGVEQFYESWLALDGFDEVARDAKSFTTEVATSLRRSLLLFATRIHSAEGGSLDALFSGQTFALNGVLRRFYGAASSSGDDFKATELPNQSRRGLLTHPALLTLLARPKASDPISRGVFIRRKLLCQDFHVPEGLDIAPLAPLAANTTTREQVAAHTSAPICAGCHMQINPPGFALEGFDQVGGWRTMEAGKRVDSSGTMTNGGELDGAFANGDELLRRIPASKAVRSCFARQYLEHAIDLGSVPEDDCALSQLQKGFAESGDITSLVTAVMRSDLFRFRMSEGVAP